MSAWAEDAAIALLLRPARLWSAAEILKDFADVPKSAGIYAWYFDEIPPGVPIVDCHRNALNQELPRVDEVPPEGWTADETHEILKASRYITKTPLTQTRNMALIGVMAELGLRRTEVASLRRESLDLEAMRLTPPKQKNRRVVPLKFSAGLAELLDDYLAHRGDEDGPLFISRKGHALGVSGINQLLKKATRYAGLDKTGKSCHAFRHGLAIAAFRNGAGHQEIRIMLRHESDTQVKKYLRIEESDRAELVRKHSPLNSFERPVQKRSRRAA